VKADAEFVFDVVTVHGAIMSARTRRAGESRRATSETRRPSPKLSDVDVEWTPPHESGPTC
jgi:hypothetical protein